MDALLIFLGFIGLIIIIYNKTGHKFTKINDESKVLRQDELDRLDPFYELNQVIYDKDPEEQGIPDSIKKGRITYNGRRLSDLSQKYWAALPSPQEWIAYHNTGNSDKIDQNLWLIEAFILYENVRWGSFDIKSVPFIEESLIFFSIHGMFAKVEDLYNVVFCFPELSFLQKEAENAIIFCSIATNLISFLMINNGGTIKDIRLKFPQEIDVISGKLHYMVKYDIIKKTKVKNYNFYEVL